MAHFHKVSVSLQSSVDLLCDVNDKKSFHYTDTRDSTEDHILFQRSHYGIVDDEELSAQVSPLCFMNALTRLWLPFFVLCLK